MHSILKSLISLFVISAFWAAPSGASFAQEQGKNPNEVYAPALYNAMKYRLIGPFRGGRVTAVSGVPDQVHTFYMGSTGGGVWKTDDGGGTWRNVSDGFFKAGSIGAIAVAASDSNVVYAGTGSACPRGNVSSGIGLYKSTDAGKSWRHIGLPEAGQIGRIVVHPRDPDLVYVAALGNVFGRNPERGVYRSLNGGDTWEKVLFVDDGTGAIDLAMDANNPRILYAGMWRVERKPWTLIDGGVGGGVFKTTDGGDSWKKLEKDLPKGVLGRIGVAVSPANSERVWVIVETTVEKEGGIYRSDDGGKTWKHVNKEHKLRGRAWYYNHIFADPQDENTLYVLNSPFFKSVDGGKSFSRIRVPHGDNHALWINPSDNRIMITGDDGGAAVTYNGCKTWSSQFNQPTAEFYRVTIDNRFPYRVYGAQQDNSTISVPSRAAGGITPKQFWFDAGGGESGHIALDPNNPNIIYAGNYIGQITRLNRDTDHIRDVVAYPELHDGLAPRDIRYRFQWNAPIRFSPHDSHTLYHASQYVHKSIDGGKSWQVISPDLTTNNDAYQNYPGGPVQHDHTGVELYTTIFSFEESPQQAGLLWAGSDDGLVHLSLDGGKNWKNITPKNMPAEGTVNTIELSPHDPARAFLAVYRYRRNDFKPYIFRTNDYGQSWDLLTDGNNGIPADHFVRVIREDPGRRGLLYAGTEFGMYISFDDGRHWQSLQLNLPITPVTDLSVHDQDLVVATQGRSFWILDDLTPLHQVSGHIAQSKVHLFEPRLAYRTQMRGFRGPNSPKAAPNGAIIYFYLSEKPGEEARLEILNGQGDLVRTFDNRPEKKLDDDAESVEKEDAIEMKAGMNRFIWDLRYPKLKIPKGLILGLSQTDGPAAPPGAYQVRISVEGLQKTESFQVRKDPRWSASDADLKAQFDLTMAVGGKAREIFDAIRRLRAARKQTKEIADRALKAGYDKKIEEMANALSRTLTGIEEELHQTKSESGEDAINHRPKLDNQFTYLYDVVNSQDAYPTRGCYLLLEDLKKKLAPHIQKLRSVLKVDLQTFNSLLEKEGVPRVILSSK